MEQREILNALQNIKVSYLNLDKTQEEVRYLYFISKVFDIKKKSKIRL